MALTPHGLRKALPRRKMATATGRVPTGAAGTTATIRMAANALRHGRTIGEKDVEDLTRNRVFDPTSEAFRLATSPFYLIAHADYMYHDQMDEVLAGTDVNKSIYRILTVLRDHQPCRMTDLADMALIKRSTVSRIIDRMLEMGLVDTDQSPDDSRATDVRMSAKGREVLDTLTPLVAPLFVEATRGLSHDELQRFVATLQIISSNLEGTRR